MVLDMAFNLGVRGLSKFRNALAAMEARDYATAAEEMMDSRWAQQVGGRAARLAVMMETGQWPDVVTRSEGT